MTPKLTEQAFKLESSKFQISLEFIASFNNGIKKKIPFSNGLSSTTKRYTSDCYPGKKECSPITVAYNPTISESNAAQTLKLKSILSEEASAKVEHFEFQVSQLLSLVHHRRSPIHPIHVSPQSLLFPHFPYFLFCLQSKTEEHS
jgi:hypothetical protein